MDDILKGEIRFQEKDLYFTQSRFEFSFGEPGISDKDNNKKRWEDPSRSCSLVSTLLTAPRRGQRTHTENDLLFLWALSTRLSLRNRPKQDRDSRENCYAACSEIARITLYAISKSNELSNCISPGFHWKRGFFLYASDDRLAEKPLPCGVAVRMIPSLSDQTHVELVNK